ncbi:MAG: hypothetical protein O3A25_00885 [Acidobacteria bacterium]|nr:hypothetical protein [Acidobacteriota bacterium]
MIENDESLSWLRKHKSDAVEALVANHSDAPDEPVEEPNPLAEYTMIGDENAKRLKESAITTAAELL